MNTCNCGARPGLASGPASRRTLAAVRFPVRGNPLTGNGSAEVRRPQDLVRRFLHFVGWILPTVILALIPKCPACVAGYAVIGTSMGFSLSGFAQLRLALIVLCVVSLSYVGIKSVLSMTNRNAAKRHL